MIETIVVLAAALIIGCIASTQRRTKTDGKVDGVGLEAIVSPLLALTTLLLAFVLVQVFTSHNRARLSAGDEAGKVLGEFRLFAYFSDEHSSAGQSILLCYTRSVMDLEWPAMAGSGIAIVPEVTHWGLQLDRVLTDLALSATPQPLGSLISADQGRTDARRRRVAEARPAVPIQVSWLMLAVSAAAILSIAAFTSPSVSRRLQTGALMLLTVVFASMQIAILEIDSKYEGWIRVDPSEMQLLRGVLEQQFAAEYPGISIPCDVNGRPLR